MILRGVNGATSGTLNERFIKCAGCRVNVPKDDMLALGKCTVCNCPYKAVVTEDGRGIEVAMVAFDGHGAPGEKKPPRKRWAVLTSKRGRTFYHNSETGEDRWDKPTDLEADAAEDAFVPLKNDAVKKAVLREQMKLEATKMGVPVEVVAATQHRLQHEDEADDPFAKMMVRGDKTGKKNTFVRADSPKQKAVVQPEEEKRHWQCKRKDKPADHAL
ncbi:unnamed protein product [Peronospora destructor]|uniref:WW domain-containing protein n=1 Tax=Peronospora destructor TaxID=86335 RepID=A0AAV0V048_9STRA|nr:unnamed protein product [Peronospora destructor]